MYHRYVPFFLYYVMANIDMLRVWSIHKHTHFAPAVRHQYLKNLKAQYSTLRWQKTQHLPRIKCLLAAIPHSNILCFCPGSVKHFCVLKNQITAILPHTYITTIVDQLPYLLAQPASTNISRWCRPPPLWNVMSRFIVNVIQYTYRCPSMHY